MSNVKTAIPFNGPPSNKPVSPGQPAEPHAVAPTTPGPAPGGGPGAFVPPGSGSAPKATPIGYGGHARTPTVKNVAVRNMQVVMQDLAQIVIEGATDATMFRKAPDATHQQGTQQQVAGKKAFNDFLAEQYVGGLGEDRKGVEWAKNPAAQSFTAKDKTKTDIYELDAVMNTFKRIGSPGSEFKADGVWQFRTNNALRNMMGFADALLSLEGDFGLDNGGVYTKESLDGFKSLLSGYDVDEGSVKLSEDQKTRRATKIIPHLKAIARLYNSFRRQILSKPVYRSLIENARPFDQYNQSGSNANTVATADEMKMAQDQMAIASGLRYNGYGRDNNVRIFDSIPLSVLVNKESFEKYVKEVLNYPDAQIKSGVAARLLNVIQQQLNQQG